MILYPRKTSLFLIFLLLFAQVFSANIVLAQSYDLLPTAVEVIVSCGDGVAEPPGEICDPGDISLGYPVDTGTTTCPDFNDIFGDPFESGDLGCESDCLAFSTSTCWTCGNGYKEQEEVCDGTDFGGASCTSFGFSGGTLLCTAECQINTANCEADTEPGGSPGGGSSGGGSGQTTTGFNPGSDTENVTRVVVRGKSYPNSDVHILVDGKVTGIVKTDSKADFYFESEEIPAGVASFGFWSEDVDGLKSTLLTLTFRATLGAVTTITGVYIAPTIDVDKKSVRQGDDIVVFGKTVPESVVNIHINSEEEHIEQTSSTEEGNWQIVFNTEPLEEAFHTAKANFQFDIEGNVIKSGFSKSVSFAISKLGGEAICPEGDLNGDGRVNLTDFSILLFHWGTDNACADQNQNGNVDLIDFSIMMYYWTG